MKMSRDATFKRWPTSLLALTCVFALASLFTAGCGGGGSKSSSGGGANTPQPTANWKQVGATFAGRAACRDCHATIDEDYGTQNHGLNFRVVHGDQIEGNAGRCAACHTTGFDEPSGYSAANKDPKLEGIGCEECHGPGSKHIAADSGAARRANITRVPPTAITCLDCHVPSYKQLRTATAPVNDESLKATAPSKVTIHRPPLMAGKLLYNSADKPGPHATIPNTCVACHMKYKTGLNGKMDHSDAMLHPDIDTTQVACASCHGGGRSEQLVQAGIKELLCEVGGKNEAGEPDESGAGGLLGAYAAAHSDVIKLDGSNDNADNANVKAYKAARYNFEYVLLDGSMGVHNPALAKALLEQAKAKLAE